MAFLQSVFGGSKTQITSNLKTIINNRIAGYINNASWTIDYGVRAIYEVDRIVPRELSPGSYSIKFSLSGVKIIKQYFEDLQIIANPGLNYSLPYVSLAIMDRITNEPILNIPAAMIESIQHVAAAKGIVTFNLNGFGFSGLNGSNLIDSNYNGSSNTIIPT